MAPLIETFGRLSPAVAAVRSAARRRAGVGRLLEHRDAAEALAVGDERAPACSPSAIEAHLLARQAASVSGRGERERHAPAATAAHAR